jgi:hypothetical protein
LRNLIPLTRLALTQAKLDPPMLDAVAATRGPGLPSALLVGLKSAQALAFSLRKPVIGIHHHEAHLYSPWITGDPPRGDFAHFEPSVSLIVSGGHTLLKTLGENGKGSCYGVRLLKRWPCEATNSGHGRSRRPAMWLPETNGCKNAPWTIRANVAASGASNCGVRDLR